MFLLCYGRSEEARKTGDYLIEVAGGRWIESADFFSSRTPLDAIEKDSIIVLLLPLEASVGLLGENFSPTLKALPVICVSPAKKFAAILSRGNETSLADPDQAYKAISKLLGPSCFTDFGNNSDFAPNLMNAIESYNMTASDEELLKEANSQLKEGKRVSIYSDLPIAFAEPQLDMLVFDVNRYGPNQKESFIQAYISSVKSKSEAISIFITCSKLPEVEGQGKALVLIPKLVEVGLELTARTSPEYAADYVEGSLTNHGIDPRAVMTVAVSSSARENDAVHAVADRLDSAVTAYGIKTLENVRLPLQMTFAPEKVSGDICTAAACLASDGGKILIRRAGTKTGVIFTAALRKGNLILTD